MNASPHLLICISAEGAEDLQVLKVYRRLAEESAESKGFFRIIDDSGEGYLYPQASFHELPLPSAVEEELARISHVRVGRVVRGQFEPDWRACRRRQRFAAVAVAVTEHDTALR